MTYLWIPIRASISLDRPQYDDARRCGNRIGTAYSRGDLDQPAVQPRWNRRLGVGIWTKWGTQDGALGVDSNEHESSHEA